jgi:hypothetical protein
VTHRLHAGSWEKLPYDTAHKVYICLKIYLNDVKGSVSRRLRPLFLPGLPNDQKYVFLRLPFPGVSSFRRTAEKNRWKNGYLRTRTYILLHVWIKFEVHFKNKLPFSVPSTYKEL